MKEQLFKLIMQVRRRILRFLTGEAGSEQLRKGIMTA
jgi:hypothetical protein